MNAFRTLIYEKRDGIAHVTLNRPQALNSYNIQMRDDLYELLGAIREDEEVSAVLFRGAGEKAFCAGADLSEFLTAPSPVVARRVRWSRDVWGRLLGIAKPMIAALHGYVLGSGIEIALCCDIRIASEDARFGLPEVGLGIIPAAGGTQTLPRTLGRGTAIEMMLTNRWIDAAEAHRVHLVQQVVPRDKLFAVAEERARKMTRLNHAAVALAKKAVLEGLNLSLAEGLDLERRLACRLPIAGKE